MGDRRPAMCHTDPPYCVKYDRRNRPTNKAARPAPAASAIVNDDLTPKQYRRASASQLNCQLLSEVQSVRLYDLDGSGAIEQLAADIRAYWRKHTAVVEE